MTRKDIKTYDNDLSAAKFTINSRLEIWGTNSSLSSKIVKLWIQCFRLDGTSAQDEGIKVAAELAPNASTEIWSGNIPGQPPRTSDSKVPEPIVVSARLLDDNNEVIARYASWLVTPTLLPGCFAHLLS